MSQKSEVQDVKYLIIGGGISGLAAGRKLFKEHGEQDYLILEAQEQPGGRIRTVKTKNGFKADVGASWIGETQTRMMQLVKEYKVQLTLQYEKGVNILELYKEKQLKYKGLIPPLSLISLIRYQWYSWQIDRMASKVNLWDPRASPNAKEQDSITFKEYIEKRLKNEESALFQRAFEIIFGVKCHKISLLHALQYIKSGQGIDSLIKGEGGAQHYKVEGGTSTLINAMYEEQRERIVLSCAVKSISLEGEDLYEVVGELGGQRRVFRAEKIIVAVPPRVLKNIKFTPALSESRQRYIQESKAYGFFYKFCIFYREPFWRQEGLSGQVMTLESFVVGCFDGETDAKSEYYKIIGFLDAEIYEARYKNKSEAETHKAILRELEKYFGKKVMDYLEIIVNHELCSSTYIQGCPTGILGPNVLTSLKHAVQEPEKGLYWAATETADIWQGFMEGAVRSGERAVCQMLGEKYVSPPTNSSKIDTKLLIFLIVVLLVVIYSIFA